MKGSEFLTRAWPLSSIGTIALAYVAIDHWRERATSAFGIDLEKKIQPILWSGFAISALYRARSYRHWPGEFRAGPKFLASLLFMVAALSVEVVMVQFATVVLGLDWHRSTPPLPDPGQWILLALNQQLPEPITYFLRMRLIELHHYLVLFILLAFSPLYGGWGGCNSQDSVEVISGRAENPETAPLEGGGRPDDTKSSPGLGLAARYCFAMGIGRLLRAFTFSGTILPSPRPWCAEHRFWSTPSHPAPWAQQYYAPYQHDQDALRELLRLDQCFAPAGHYPPEYTPSWGGLQFLAPLIRPVNPRIFESHGISGRQGIIRPGGGCNDLAFSGHMLVAVLTACAWQEASPGVTAGVVWALAIHSGQREIRERHHYTLDVVAAFYVGVLIWNATSAVWSPPFNRRPLLTWLWAPLTIVCRLLGWKIARPDVDAPGPIDNSKQQDLGAELAARVQKMTKAAKDGDSEMVLKLLEDARWAANGRLRGELKTGVAAGALAGGLLLVAGCLGLVLLVFVMCAGG